MILGVGVVVRVSVVAALIVIVVDIADVVGDDGHRVGVVVGVTVVDDISVAFGVGVSVVTAVDDWDLWRSQTCELLCLGMQCICCRLPQNKQMLLKGIPSERRREVWWNVLGCEARQQTASGTYAKFVCAELPCYDLHN